MILSIVWNISPVALSLGPVEIRWYGLLWAIGIMLAYWMVGYLFKRENAPESYTEQLFYYGVLGAILGARFGDSLFYHWDQLLRDPLAWLVELPQVWHGGLASHGGALGLIIALWIYSRRVTHRSYYYGMDHLVVGVCLTAFCIRLGNLMNSEIYGGPTALPWGFQFPNDYAWPQMVAQFGPDVTCHPTQIYEMLYCLVAFAVCCLLYFKFDAIKHEGLLYGAFLLIVFGTRFCLEFIKNDQEAFEQGMALNMGQILSIPLIIWGFYSIYRSFKKS